MKTDLASYRRSSRASGRGLRRGSLPTPQPAAFAIARCFAVELLIMKLDPSIRESVAILGQSTSKSSL